MELDKSGAYEATIHNLLLILENDPKLKGAIAYNEFSHRTIIKRNLPWHKLENVQEGDSWKDSDDAALRYYIEKIYNIVHPSKIADAVSIVENRHKYHPIREYFAGLKWDGVKRVESLFIDYLGAKDTSYIRAVTRKSLAGAVGRVLSPGIKFDYMVVLVGAQGIGKSHIINLLGGRWYSDSLNTVMGKEAYEQLQGVWIVEMAELSATKKVEVEAVKHFISKREDIYRLAYGKRTSKFPRQCIFIGTTNDNEFLRDKTGNRRFWPVVVGVNKRKKSLWEQMDKDCIDQIWAEAIEIWNGGEQLYLQKEDEINANMIRELHMEYGAKEGVIKEFLELPLPDNWSEMDTGARRIYIHGTDFGSEERGNVRRDRVCALEIWVELFQGDIKHMTLNNSREINDILRNIEGWKAHDKSSGRMRFGGEYGTQRAFVRVEN